MTAYRQRYLHSYRKINNATRVGIKKCKLISRLTESQFCGERDRQANMDRLKDVRKTSALPCRLFLLRGGTKQVAPSSSKGRTTDVPGRRQRWLHSRRMDPRLPFPAPSQNSHGQLDEQGLGRGQYPCEICHGSHFNYQGSNFYSTQ